MPRTKYIEEVSLKKEEDLPKALYLTGLSGEFLTGFSGDNYSDSVRIAREWEKASRVDMYYPYHVTLISKFEQRHVGKSILVGYDRKAKVKRENGTFAPFIEDKKEKSPIFKEEYENAD